MNSYNFIIDNNTGLKHSIFSEKGRFLLKSYVKTYKNGGFFSRFRGSKAEKHIYKCDSDTTDDKGKFGTFCRKLDEKDDEDTREIPTHVFQCIPDKSCKTYPENKTKLFLDNFKLINMKKIADEEWNLKTVELFIM